MAELEKVDLESKDIVAERIEQLRDLFPEVFSEGGIDFEKLRLELGDEVEDGDERYAFTWPGKKDAIRQSQTPSTATLRPAPEDSVNWDTTKNLYIEGDNLEVLKLLQRAYYGKVKMIYIDPPYNTGHDFVYSDTFSEPVENYKEQSNLSEQSNSDASGSYHSNWCSMMLPRLRLARDLLAEDGAIFISIDGTEVSNLLKICDEVFGENHRQAIITWQRKYSVSNNYIGVASVSDFILLYSKSDVFSANLLPRTDEATSRYSNPDNDPRGPWKAVDFLNQATTSQRPNLCYDIVNPNNGAVIKNREKAWKYEKATTDRLIAENRIWWGRDGNNSVPALKRFLSEVRDGLTPSDLWTYDEVGHTQEATKEVEELFGTKVFSFPKPTRLIKRMLQIASSQDSLVMDFFSGSATTAEAVMELNREDGGNRAFILVQLPEACSSTSIAANNGFEKICQIGEERIRLAGKKIAAEVEEANRQLKLGEEPKKVPDIGFRVLKLDESGIARPKPGELLLERVKEGRTDEDIIFEMMLRWGLELTYPIERTEIGGYPCYSVAGDALICCMQPGLTVEAIEAIAELEPERVFMLDSILDDSLKLNALQIFKRVEERTQQKIDLRTV